MINLLFINVIVLFGMLMICFIKWLFVVLELNIMILLVFGLFVCISEIWLNGICRL